MKFWRDIKVAFFLAGRSLVRGNVGVGILTTFMMSLIFMSLMFLPSLIENAIIKVNQQLVQDITSDILVTSAGPSLDIPKSKDLVAKINSTEGVVGSTAVYRVGSQLSHGADSGSWGIDSINPTNFSQVIDTPNQLIEGEKLAPGDTDSILLGVGIAGADQTTQRDYALSLRKVHAGDTVTLTLLNGAKQDFKVKGIYLTNFPMADDRGYITVAASNKLLPQTTDRATAIYVRLKNSTQRSQVISRISSLRKDLKFQTPADLAGGIKDLTDSFAIINNILGVISLTVAAITIFIVTYVDLVNRSRQIGIERAVGIKSSAIVTSYLIKAVVYSIIGTSLGVLLYIYVAVPIVIQYPFHFPNGPVTLAVNPATMWKNALILVFVAVISALIPAYRSVKIRILDAIWG